ncbi:unnamed protein product [Ceratitis capitata]|uniref:(Mediterranean fruit fly) hypothetical protein n=1 Tax=Ceratitis capitata TaxID=7213 RepID=A0A811UX86_CERCA|nr:unnamed protein product [Ceratitis capitata]
MLERRPLWGLIVLLNVCFVIWRMQEPALLSVEYDGSGAGSVVNSQPNYEGQHASRNHQQIGDKQLQPIWPPRPKDLALRNAREPPQQHQQQQLYAGKHLLAESAEVYESAVKVTRKADDDNSLLHISGHISSSTGTSTNSMSSSSSSSSRFSSTSRKNKSKQLFKVYATTSSRKSTPSPLVTAATLRNNADLPATTTLSARAYTFPPDDFHQLIDLHDFTYLINQNGCSRDIQALILVHSAPANEEKRRLIRDTWANTDILPLVNGVMPLRVIFLLGTVDSEALQLDIDRENFENGDIVQGSFVDSYRNMTYKHVMAFKWFLYNCAHAQILIKADDDVYVNTPQLLIYLAGVSTAGSDGPVEGVAKRTSSVAAADALATAAITTIQQSTADNDSRSFEDHTIENSSSSSSNSGTSTSSTSNMSNSNSSHANQRYGAELKTHSKNTTQFNAAQMLFRHPHELLLCKTTLNAMVKRSYRSKWRVSAHEFPGRYYPPYCPGFAIIYSPDVAWALYNAAQKSNYFWIDDVHITGVLAQNLSIAITNAKEYILYESDCDDLLNDVVRSDDVEFLYAWHLINPQQMQKLWELYLAKAQRYFSVAPKSWRWRRGATRQQTSYNPTDFNKFKSYR